MKRDRKARTGTGRKTIDLKCADDLKFIREAGRFAAMALEAVADAVAPGVSTLELARLAEEVIGGLGCQSAFLGYQGYPGSICVSVNEEVVHGIPGERRLRGGDLVSIDLGVKFKGYFGDNATTVTIGATEGSRDELVRVTREALVEGIGACRAGNRLSDISSAVERTAVKAGFSVVRDFVGHGIGRHLHEEPQIPNFGAPGRGPVLKAGMVLCIEPMINIGSGDVEVLKDGWTAVTRDRQPSAHFEHMVAILDDGVEILSLS